MVVTSPTKEKYKEERCDHDILFYFFNNIDSLLFLLKFLRATSYMQILDKRKLYLQKTKTGPQLTFFDFV